MVLTWPSVNMALITSIQVVGDMKTYVSVSRRKHMMKIRVFDEICSIMVESKIVTNVRPALKFISSMFLPIKSLISRSSILFVVVDFSLLFDRVNKRQKGYITHLSFSCLNKKESINTRFFFPIYPCYK